MPESYAGKINRKLLKKQRIIAAAAGREPADLVLKNATFVNVFSNELSTMDIAVAEGLIVGMGSYQGRSEVDCTGKIVLPRFPGCPYPSGKLLGQSHGVREGRPASRNHHGGNGSPRDC